jgi:predicted nucleotidyltransferase
MQIHVQGINMSAVDFLLPPRTQRMLAPMFDQPERDFTLKELLDRAGGSRSASQAQIERLIVAGVLQEEPRRGWQRGIRINRSYFLYPELRNIALKTFGLVEPLRKAIDPFASRIDEAFVFGSVAKQTDDHRSDIDFLVVGSAPLLELSSAVLDVENEIGRPIHLSLYSSQEWAELKSTDSVLAQIGAGAKLQVLPK